jgi:hypothetical protein
MEAERDFHDEIASDIWGWIHEFITVPNAFYQGKFAPCPFARQALSGQTVDVAVWRSGGVRQFIRRHAFGMLEERKLTTRVMVLPPRPAPAFSLQKFVDDLNRNLIPENVFLNPGLAKGTRSRYPQSPHGPYSIVVANDLGAVLRGSEALHRTEYYDRWPEAQYEFVVRRRAGLAARFSRRPGA